MSQNLLFNIIFLPVILVIGIATSYEDQKTSRIRNNWILLGLIYSLAVYLVSFFLYLLMKYQVIPYSQDNAYSYLFWNFGRFCANLAISAVAAYLLWHYKMWGAGDAKLFITYAALIPLGRYSRVYFGYYFESVFLLMAIFIPATVFLLLKSIFFFLKKFNFRMLRERAPLLFKEKLSRYKGKDAIRVFFGFLVYFLFFRVLKRKFRKLLFKSMPDQNYLAILLPVLLFKQFSKFFKKHPKIISATFVILMAYFAIRMPYPWEDFISEIGKSFKGVISVMVLFPIVRKIINMYLDRSIQETTPFAGWMFLGALITWFY